MRVPFIVYADFESFTPSHSSYQHANQTLQERHQAVSETHPQRILISHKVL